jgi:Fe-S-cluster-containing dehydrogenase component
MPAPDRRAFLLQTGKLIVLTASAAAAWDYVVAGQPENAPDYDASAHWWAMIIDVERCIGCGRCVQACKAENGVSTEPYYFRTWVERYEIDPADPEHPRVESPNGGYDGFPENTKDGVKTFFVPKLCNHCADSPCVQVCPVGATFQTPDGVVLVDKEYCLGCRHAPTGAATSIRKLIQRTSARSATTGSPRGCRRPVSRSAPLVHGTWAISRILATLFTNSCERTWCRC